MLTPVLVPDTSTLCFWLHAKPSVLDRRLDKRVHGMVKNARVLHEHTHFSASAEAGRCNEHDGHGTATDSTVGLFQCIRYNKLYDYVRLGPRHFDSPMLWNK